jgi:hypothetical protein
MPTTSYGSALPPITIRAGITNSPLLTTPVTWTDISAYVQKVSWHRGRQHVLNSFEPGQCTIEAWQKNDSALDPLNADSSYFGQLGLNTPIQVCVTFNQMTANQTRANAASWTAGANTTLTLTAGSATVTGSVKLQAVSNGTISANTPTGTSGFVVGSNVPVVLALVSTAAATNRTVTMTVTWYNAAGSSLGTSTVSATESGLVANLLASTTTPVGTAYGSVQYSVAGAVTSEIHTATNVGVLMAQATSAVASSAYYDGGPQPLFTGFLDQLDPNYENQMKSKPKIIASDALRLLNDYAFTTLTYETQVVTDSATGFWTLSDNASGTAVDSTASPHNGTYAGSYTQGVAGPFASESATATTFDTDDGGWVSIPLAARINTTGAFCIEGWFKTTESGIATLFQQSDGGHVDVNGTAIAITINGGQVQGLCYLAGAGPIDHRYSAASTYNDGNWHYVMFGRTAASGTVVLAVDNTWATNTATSNNYDCGTGAAAGIRIGASLPGLFSASTIAKSEAEWAIYNASCLTQTQAQDHYSRGQNGFATQLSGARINTALSLVGWPAGWTVSGISSVGNSNIAFPTSSLTGTSVLTYTQACALAENGYLFANEAGSIQFLDRHAITTPVVLGTAGATVFGDMASQGEIRYRRQPDIGIDNTDFANGAQVTRSGGVTQTVAPTTTSVNTYGTKRYLVESGLLLTTDAESLARAQYDQNQFGTPKVRARTLEVDVIAPGNISAITAFAATGSVSPLGLTSTVTVNRRPYTEANGFNDGHAAGSPLFNQLSMIEGIEHEIDLAIRTWTARLHCAAADTTKYWILGTSALDTGTVLAYFRRETPASMAEVRACIWSSDASHVDPRRY